jgi:hypothetical protein
MRDTRCRILPLIHIVERAAADLVTSEIQKNKTHPFRGWGADVTINEPTSDRVHDTMTINLGPISVAID